MDRIVIVVFSIAFACTLLLGASYAATWLTPYFAQVPPYCGAVLAVGGGMIAGAAAVWRRHRNGGLRASR